MKHTRVEHTLELPKTLGLHGCLAVLGKVLRLPRLLSLEMKGNKLRYERYCAKDEPPLSLDLSDDPGISIRAAIAAGDILEIHLDSAFQFFKAIDAMFAAAEADQLHPVCFGVSNNSVFWSWYRASVDRAVRNTLYGYPIYVDSGLNEDAIFLACAYGADADLSEIRQTYKVLMPLTVQKVQDLGIVEKPIQINGRELATLHDNVSVE